MSDSSPRTLLYSFLMRSESQFRLLPAGWITLGNTLPNREAEHKSSIKALWSPMQVCYGRTVAAMQLTPDVVYTTHTGFEP